MTPKPRFAPGDRARDCIAGRRVEIVEVTGVRAQGHVYLVRLPWADEGAPLSVLSEAFLLPDDTDEVCGAT